jgi:hypothetical protein
LFSTAATAPSRQAAVSSAPVLSRWTRCRSASGSDLVLAVDVEHLPADHAGRPARPRQLDDEVADERRVGVLGQHPERHRRHRVAGQDGHRLAERLVAGRAAAAEVVVVHRRQVVVDEAERVNELDRGGRRDGRLVRRRVAAAGPAGLEDEARAEPLAAGQQAVVDRVEQPRRGVGRVPVAERAEGRRRPSRRARGAGPGRRRAGTMTWRVVHVWEAHS